MTISTTAGLALALATSTSSAVDELKLLAESLEADQQERTVPPKAPAMATTTAFLQTLNPDLSAILDVAGAFFDGDPAQTGAHDPNRTGFTFQQLELHLGASVDPYFGFQANVVFALDGVEIEEAYGTTLRLPGGFQARAGQFLTRFGRQNSTHPHTWHFVDQPLVFGKFFGPEGNSGLGAEVSWLAPLPWYFEVVTSANDFGGVTIDGLEDFQYTAAIKQFFPFDENWSLFFGLSGQHTNRAKLAGADLYLRWRPVDSADRTAVSLAIEGIARRRSWPNLALTDLGLLTQLVYTIDPRWEAAARYELVTGTNEDPVDADWTSDRHRIALQASFYPSHFSRLRLQANYDIPTYREDPIVMVALAIELLVGAHASHSY